tara:strand:+ start:83 stop:385 length:303 start_codon:yes stop_codon:yes gene_type:complete
MKPINERKKVIKNYELGLSEFMLRNGVVASSAFQHSVSSRSKEGLHIFNPTHGAAEDLFEQYGILKIETYRTNPHQIDLNFLFANNAHEILVPLQEGMKN